MRTSCLACVLAFAILGLGVSPGSAGEQSPLPNQRQGVFVARDFKFQTQLP